MIFRKKVIKISYFLLWIIFTAKVISSNVRTTIFIVTLKKKKKQLLSGFAQQFCDLLAFYTLKKNCYKSSPFKWIIFCFSKIFLLLLLLSFCVHSIATCGLFFTCIFKVVLLTYYPKSTLLFIILVASPLASRGGLSRLGK